MVMVKIISESWIYYRFLVIKNENILFGVERKGGFLYEKGGGFVVFFKGLKKLILLVL